MYQCPYVAKILDHRIFEVLTKTLNLFLWYNYFVTGCYLDNTLNHAACPDRCIRRGWTYGSIACNDGGRIRRLQSRGLCLKAQKRQPAEKYNSKSVVL